MLLRWMYEFPGETGHPMPPPPSGHNYLHTVTRISLVLYLFRIGGGAPRMT